ncbi:MAG TPA: NAD(P)/FAD-dependent oxidoreductase [Thermoanaerobaculia bacterium]|jgi:2-polyprenyl-6-methoxyphenol hydroxylase-like FAD-dependent oxidoreductase|nr:NAD(P)/FAD-dependent oxidoreductase [Thermoanaerobaculia bacterium]
MSDLDVLVVGAGPVGMMAALSLQRAGFAVEIVDEGQRRAGHSYAVGLHPRSVLLLERLGALELLLPFAQRIDGVTLRGDGEERRLPLQGLPDSHDFGLAVPQSRLEEVLEKALRQRGVAVGWNQRLHQLDPDVDPPLAVVDVLRHDTSDSPFAEEPAAIDRRRLLRPRLVIGADGHRSTVARKLGIAAPNGGPARTFAAFEVRLPERACARDLQLLLGRGTVDAVWPLRDGWSRCTFEVDAVPELDAAPRRKERTTWWIGSAEMRELFARLWSERAPQLPMPTEVGWTGAARFEHGLAASWGRGRVWLLGDAAHLASPLASHSLNRGFHEADALATTLRSTAGGDAAAALSAWAESSRRLWRQLAVAPVGGDDPWLAPYAEKLPAALPATGAALRELLSRLLTRGALATTT